MRTSTRYGAVVALVVVTGFAVRLSAQTDNSGNPTILQAVHAVQSSLDGLVSTLNAFIAAQAPRNVSFTPPVVAFAPDTFICTATNVSAEARTIRVQVINGNTATTLVENSPAGISVGSGLSTAAAIAATSTRAFCKITVGNGDKTDVRGALALFASGSASDKLVIAAE
jgi:hypothetical protein